MHQRTAGTGSKFVEIEGKKTPAGLKNWHHQSVCTQAQGTQVAAGNIQYGK